MKSLLLTTLAAFISLQSAEARNAPFYTWPNPHSSVSKSSKPEVLSHVESRLTLASRLGLSQYHNIGNTVDIYKLQRLASPQRRLWTGKNDVDGTILITVGGMADPDSFWDEKPAFEVKNSPSLSEFETLVKNLESQTEKVLDTMGKNLYSNAHGGFVDVVSPVQNSGIDLSPHINQWNLFEKALGETDASRFKSNNPVDVAFFEEYMVLNALADKTIDQVIAEKATVFIHLGSLDRIAAKDGVNSQKHKAALRIMSPLITDLIKLSSTYPCIFGLVPPSEGSAKRSDNLEFVGEKIKRKESPLAPVDRPGPSVAEDVSPVAVLQKDKKKIVYTKPGCFKSKDVCSNSTNSCNGRGACIKSTVQFECWSCACTPSVIKVGQYNKTTYWGGNACQKKDVSVPFLLFVFFGVGITLALAWTVGKLLSMGDEELPGELSAGVAIVRK